MSDIYSSLHTSPYRVWHIPQIPGKPFIVDCDTVAEAAKFLDVLAQYDLFQYENRIKPDYSNAAGILIWDVIADEYEDYDPEYHLV